ncbi:hypothetical protein PY365_11000 [Roseiarcaceae bacterium H3SJ34-1]|uniref:hypothetical protein n=1 Tax=Terripilifer ovatus TaxID=3032367 RepID=UPI003AB9BAB4|nr:hypothetical protein [Roseiarcaceae bacterium H3SJ34-1]
MRSQQDIYRDLLSIFDVFGDVNAEPDKHKLISLALDAIKNPPGSEPEMVAARLRAWAPNFKQDWVFATLHDAAALIELHQSPS